MIFGENSLLIAILTTIIQRQLITVGFQISCRFRKGERNIFSSSAMLCLDDYT